MKYQDLAFKINSLLFGGDEFVDSEGVEAFRRLIAKNNNKPLNDMTYSEIQDSLFEIYEGAYRAGQLNPNIQDNTMDDSPENEDVLDNLYELASKLNGELK